MLHAFRLFGSLGMERLLEVFFGKKARFDCKFWFETKKRPWKIQGRFGFMVETMGIEPTTSALRTLRSPN